MRRDVVIRAAETPPVFEPVGVNVDGVVGTFAVGTVSVSTGEPPSEGDLVHGELFTITGSGFGTRSDYNNVDYTWQGHSPLHFRFKDFADQSLTSGGFSLSGSGPWSIRSPGRTGSGYILGPT